MLVPIDFTRRNISEIAGSISIACWVVVFVPQIYENFRRKSSEGLSLLFIILWLIGDIFNVAGAIMQHLLPTMIILAAYYTIADIILWFQCIWYNKKDASGDRTASMNRTKTSVTKKSLPEEIESTITEETVEAGAEYEPMISGDTLTNDSTARRHHEFSTTSTTTSTGGAIEIDVENGCASSKVRRKENYLWDACIVISVMFSGFLSWYISYCNSYDKRNTSTKTKAPVGNTEDMNLVAQIFGYLSAVLYLGSRVPQILLNYKRKSCDGVSLLFFLFACIGNLTFIFSVLAVSLDSHYLLVNASWLIGSAGTLILDMTIFCQFFVYNHDKNF